MDHSIIINPATGEEIAKYKRLTADEVEEKITISKEAYLQWKQKTYQERAVLMHKHASVLEQNK